MFEYGRFRFASNQELFDKSVKYWNPDKAKFLRSVGVDLVIDRLEGCFRYGMPRARELIHDARET